MSTASEDPRTFGGGALLRMGTLAGLWGSTFLWIKLCLNGGFAPVQITVIRSALGAGVLFLLAVYKGQQLPRDRATWGHLLVAALFCNALPFALFGFGEQTVDSGVAGVVHATTPLWSMAIGIAIGTDRGLDPVRVGGLVVGFLGTVLIFAPWDESGLLSWGAFAILAAAASYAIGFAYMARHLVGRDAPVAMSAAQLIAAIGLSAVVLPFAGLGSSGIDATGVAAVVVLGIFATGVTFYLSYRIIEDEGATAAATVGYLLPVVSVALGAIVLSEALNARIVIGMVVVLAGVGLTRLRPLPIRPSTRHRELRSRPWQLNDPSSSITGWPISKRG
jgi:drug/metabolite transporter (DMT)-like permease